LTFETAHVNGRRKRRDKTGGNHERPELRARRGRLRRDSRAHARDKFRRRLDVDGVRQVPF